MADYQLFCLIKLALTCLGAILTGFMFIINDTTGMVFSSIFLPVMADLILGRKTTCSAEYRVLRVYIVPIAVLLMITLIGFLMIVGRSEPHMSIGGVLVIWFLLELILPKGLVFPQPYKDRKMDEREEVIHKKSTLFAFGFFWFTSYLVSYLIPSHGVEQIPVQYVKAAPAAGFLLISFAQAISGLVLYKKDLPHE